MTPTPVFEPNIKSLTSSKTSALYIESEQLPENIQSENDEENVPGNMNGE